MQSSYMGESYVKNISKEVNQGIALEHGPGPDPLRHM